MFTREYLQSLATATVFSRGKEYFRAGSVGRLSREGDKFTANVHGSYPYKVQLTLKAGGAKLKCNCPYEFEGICKHAVALGLAVLKEFGPSLTASGGAASAPSLSPSALEAALRDTPTAAQLTFLAEVLRRNNALAQQFLAAHAGPAAAGTAPAVPAAFTIDSISTEVYEALSDLAFDDELLDNYDKEYTSYRYDETDTLLEAADEAIAEVLIPYAEAVAEALHDGHLADALRRWVGVYEGSAAATEPAADDHDLFGYEGYPAHVQGHWWELLANQEIPQLLETTPFAAAETETALALLAGCYRKPATVPQGAAGKTKTAAGTAPLQLPPHFHDLLHALAHDPATAARLRPLLAEVPQPGVGLARVLLRVAEVLADDALWLRTSETFAAHDAALTVQLLDRYRERGDRASLRRVLAERRAQFSHILNPYILSHLSPEEDQPLYLAALEQRCRHTRSLPDYRTLQTYWNPIQRRAFVDEQLALGIRAGQDPLFGAELLLAENRAAELLPYLLRLNWTWQRSVPEVLALAAPSHPDDCLDAVLERTEALLQDPMNGRGRERYQRIAAWLTALNTVQELRPPVALFAAHLYTEYVRLNALREELRAARLVRTQLVGKQHRLVVSEAEDEEVRALLRDKQGRPGR